MFLFVPEVVVPRRLTAYIWAVNAAFLAGVAAVAAAGTTSPLPSHPWHVVPLLGIAIISEGLIVAQQDGDGDHLLSFSAAAHIATVILFGPVPAAVVAVLAVVLVDGVRMVHPRWIALNASMFGIAILISGYVYQLLGGTTGAVTSSSALALLALVAMRPLVNSVLYVTGIAISAGGAWRTMLAANLRDTFGVAIGESSLGVVLASAYTAERWIVLPFLVPLLAALYTSSSTLERLKRETSAALRSFARIIDQRDPHTASHTERVAAYVEQFVAAIGLSDKQAQRLVAAARYHDLGKVAVDVSTLLSDRRLSEAELRSIRSHPRLSARLLSPFHFAREMARYVELHHERYDGVGYYGVPADEIPIEAHVLIAADSFDAMTSHRAYRPALTAAEAAAELRDKAGSQFHPEVARAFAATVEGRALQDELTAEELDRLRALFATVRVLPPIDAARLVGPGSIAITATSALILMAFAGERATLAPLAAAAVISDGWMVSTLVRRHRRRALLERRLEQQCSIGEALAASGVEGEVMFMVWDPNADVYMPRRETPSDGDLLIGEEVASRAMRVFADEARLLANGSSLWLSSDEDWDVRLAIITRRPLTQAQRRLAELAARAARRRVEPIARRVDEAVEAPPDATRTADRGMLMIRLSGFEEIRTTAGHLVARRTVAAAEQAIAGVLRGEDRVLQLGEDTLAVLLTDSSAVPHICRRIKGCLERVEVPARAHKLTAEFSEVPGEATGAQAA